MSSETIVTAIFLITAVVAAGVLTSQVFPAIYSMSGSVSSSTKSADQALRTDISIVNTFALAGTSTAEVWLKNTGTSRTMEQDLPRCNIFIGSPGDFEVMAQSNYMAGPPVLGTWTYDIIDDNNEYWDPGETLHLKIMSSKLTTLMRGDPVYFQIVFPDGTKRSEEFTVS
jgi:archaeal flagellar protein FlaG